MDDSVFITPKKSDNFSTLRGIDLQNLLVEVESYYLEYRDRLNLPSDVTFGVEIEYEKMFDSKTRRFINKNVKDWKFKFDASLVGGGEIVSPIMTDDIKYWKELEIICNHLNRMRADTLHNAGGHIHVGATSLGKDMNAWRQFLKLYIAYENVLFRFWHGDKLSGRKGLLKYASPSADDLYKKLKYINNISSLSELSDVIVNDERYKSLNCRNVRFWGIDYIIDRNTIEFRGPNASTSAVIWQNNINAFTKMIVSSKEKIMDEEFLDYKLSCEYFPYLGNEYLYNNINLKNVLEFVDLVFDNNLDKVYFLRQYLKNFEENNGLSVAVKIKKFVK